MIQFQWPKAVRDKREMAERAHGLARGVDTLVIATMRRWSVPVLRVALALVFLWFGALKLVPGLSPAEGLLQATTPALPVFVPQAVIAVWEIAIGVGLLVGLWGGRLTRLTLLLLFGQMLGAMAPVVLLPERVFTVFPYGLTLEGQYIIKNVVLLAGAMAIGARVEKSEPA